MSHYMVAVFTKPDGASVDELLAPYDENIEVDRYMLYTKDELIEAYQKNHSWEIGDDYSNILAYYGYEGDSVDGDGNIYSTYNPVSKWDWWSLGGRYNCMLIVRGDGDEWVCTNEALVSDVDFERMKQIALEDLKSYDEAMAGFFKLYNSEYIYRMYPDEETYVNRETTFSTYAVITPDGAWHSPGDVGWFGMSSETPDESYVWKQNYFQNFIVPAIENGWKITIVDCHI